MTGPTSFPDGPASWSANLASVGFPLVLIGGDMMGRHQAANAGRTSPQKQAREAAGKTYFDVVRSMSDDPKVQAAADKAEAEWDRETSESDQGS